jgi:hypothetical protein
MGYQPQYTSHQIWLCSSRGSSTTVFSSSTREGSIDICVNLVYHFSSAPTLYIYSFHPFISVAMGMHATSLTRFIENTCNICISK